LEGQLINLSLDELDVVLVLSAAATHGMPRKQIRENQSPLLVTDAAQPYYTDTSP